MTTINQYLISLIILLKLRIFAKIPNNWYANNDIDHYEGFYCSLFYAFLVGMGYNVIAEDVTNHGRIDVTLILENKVYIFELKTKNQPKNPNTALQQIKSKNYAQKYMDCGYDTIYIIGAEFSEESRNLTSFAYECV